MIYLKKYKKTKEELDKITTKLNKVNFSCSCDPEALRRDINYKNKLTAQLNEMLPKVSEEVFDYARELYESPIETEKPKTFSSKLRNYFSPAPIKFYTNNYKFEVITNEDMIIISSTKELTDDPDALMVLKCYIGMPSELVPDKKKIIFHHKYKIEPKESSDLISMLETRKEDLARTRRCLLTQEIPGHDFNDSIRKRIDAYDKVIKDLGD